MSVAAGFDTIVAMCWEGAWTEDAILREAARWAYVPEGAVKAEDERRLLVHLPEHRDTSRLWRSSAADEAQARELIEQTVSDVREAGRGRLIWHTGGYAAPSFMDECLAQYGFIKTEDLEVLCLELGDSSEPELPGFSVPAEIGAEPVLEAGRLWEVQRIVCEEAASEVFSEPALSEEEVAEYAAELEKLERRRRGELHTSESLYLMFTASIAVESGWGYELKAIACAGAQIVDQALRLWGAATLERFRGRGAYGALVLQRCRMGHDLGASLAIAKAKAGTAGAILRRAGFDHVGTERRHLLEIS